MALNATALITVAAAAEYQHYVKVRDELRHPASSTPASVRQSGSTESGTGTMGLAATVGEAAETAGAGAVVAVLAPVLTGTAAAIFLLVGCILKMLDPEPSFAQTMLTTGWVFGAVTAVAILVAAVSLLLTALRNSPEAEEAGAYGELTGEVAQAREAWREALLERGIMPFLRDALADPGTAAMNRKPSRNPPPATCLDSATTAPASAAPTTARRRATAPASRARTSATRTSEARSTPSSFSNERPVWTHGNYLGGGRHIRPAKRLGTTKPGVGVARR